MIFEGSRYANTPIYRVRLSDGSHQLSVFGPEFWPYEFEFILHTVKEGDRLDLLAYTYFNDPEAWWWVAAANPEIDYPDRLVPGTKVRIPNE